MSNHCRHDTKCLSVVNDYRPLAQRGGQRGGIIQLADGSLAVAVGGETPLLLTCEQLAVFHLGRGDGDRERSVFVAECDRFGERTGLDRHADRWLGFDQRCLR